MKGKILIKPKDIIRQFNNRVVNFLEDDPDHILMSFSDANTFAPDVQKVDVNIGKYKRIKRGSESIQSWYTDRRGIVRIGQGLAGDNPSKESWRLKIRDAHEDKWRTANDYPGLEADVDVYGFTANPDELIIGRYAGRDTVGLYIYDLSQKKQTRKLFHHDKYDARGLVLSSDGKEVVGATFASDTTETKIFDGHRSSMDRVKEKLKGYVIDYVDMSADGNLLLFKASTPYDPGNLLIYNSAQDKFKALTQLRPSLPSDKMGEVISVRYSARDGVKIPAYVTIPPAITQTSDLKNLPFIILPHGGPYARDYKRFDYLAQFFASRGYGVLQMNFRGSKGYGQSFEDAGRHNWQLMLTDVEDGAKWLVNKGYADPQRVCIAGWSYGGYASLMGAIKNPDLYQCSISIAGVTDLMDMIRDMQKYRFGRLGVEDFIKKGFDDRSDMKEHSPRHQADKLKIPIFLLHGKQDEIVHYDQYSRMKSALEKNGATATFVSVDDDHYLSYQDSRQKMFTALDKFLKDNLGAGVTKK